MEAKNGRILAALTCGLLVAMAAPLLASVRTEDALDARVEAAILQEDWQAVASLLGSQRQLPPEARLILGHAYLALNRNNESLCLFLSVSSPEELGKWEQWTHDFAGRNPTQAIANYLRGDALARQQQWDGALRAFDTALERAPAHPLALNARGVAYASTGALDAAREDFRRASAAENLLQVADVFTSRGTYILQRKTEAKIALQWFQRALKISPDSLLALNGSASARILLRDWDGAGSDIENAQRLATGCLSDVRGVVALNAGTLTGERNKAVSTLLARAGIEPGFSVEERIRALDSMSPAERQVTFDVLNNAASHNRWVQGSLFPSSTTLELAGGVKGTLVGPQPYAEARAGANWDWAGKAKYNETQQSGMMAIMQERYGISKANPISNFDAWGFQHMLPDSNIGKVTSPKGVSSREIGEAPIDTGDWQVFSLYGLVYKLKSGPVSGPGRER